jgi:hypothetical protein
MPSSVCDTSIILVSQTAKIASVCCTISCCLSLMQLARPVRKGKDCIYY